MFVLIAAEWTENLRRLQIIELSYAFLHFETDRMDTLKANVSFQIPAAALCLEIYTHFSTHTMLWSQHVQMWCLLKLTVFHSFVEFVNT